MSASDSLQKMSQKSPETGDSKAKNKIRLT